MILALMIVYHSVRPLWLKNSTLLIASYAFYASFTPAYAILLFIITAATYVFAWVLKKADGQKYQRAVLSIVIAATLLPLLYFKYRNFVGENVNWLLPQMLRISTSDVLFPVGLSFFTFNILTYLIDCSRGRLNVQHSFRDYALYVSFFPSILAGPLLRPSDFLFQLKNKIELQGALIWEGLVLITLGFFKKLVVADNLSLIANPIFSQPEKFSGPELLMGAYVFTVQIYCDFSGYTDIARGVARLFGLQLPINFNFPYLAKDPSDFWGRWHISLSSWFRDYLYIPLGGNRRGTLRTVQNLFLVMFLCGLWHGASWHFVAWGIYHGVLLILYRYFDVLMSKLAPVTGTLEPAQNNRFIDSARHALSVFIMFHFIVAGWILFKADSLQIAMNYFKGITTLSSYKTASQALTHQYILACLAVLAFSIYHAFSSSLKFKETVLRLRFNPYVSSALVLMVLVIIALKVDQNVQFIYFRF